MMTVSLECADFLTVEVMLEDPHLYIEDFVEVAGPKGLLRYIGTWEITVFNSLQAPDVVEELTALRSLIRGGARLEFLDTLCGLAERCARTGASYLVFRGD
ncbi:MAG: hypothetical protein WED87_06895 [Dehalococcoidia bacterium]